MKIVGCGALGPNENRVPIDRFSLEMSGVEKAKVLVIATPKAKRETFDKATSEALRHYKELGVSAETLYEVFDAPPSVTEMEHKIGRAALINISGGDTLRAMELFKKWGLVNALEEAANRGAILTGTSAGAISWFAQGHSDSLSYRVNDGEPWDYIWVDGLNFQPGIICPHYNTATEGGEMRSTNLARMILENQTPITEPIYGIDNRAAIVVDGANIASLTIDDDHRVHIVDPKSGYSTETLPLIS